MASCTLCDSPVELDDGHDQCIYCLGPEHLKQALSDPCPSYSCLPLAICESRLARWNAQLDYSLLPIDTTLSEHGVKRAAVTVVPPPKKKKVKTSSGLERRVDQLTEGMGQIQAFLASMKNNNEEQRLAESNTVDSDRERDFDVVSVSASDSYFDEHPVITETVGSPVSLRSSSALSPGHDGEPVSVANSLRGKLKVALAKLNFDAPPSETNQAPNLFCRSSGQIKIKSLLLSHHHSTSALVSEILMSVLQTVQKNNRQFTYGQTVQKNNRQFTYGQTVQKKTTNNLHMDRQCKKTALEHLQCSRQCKKNNSNLHMDRQYKKTTAIYIWTVHIYRLYRRQCAKYTYIYSVRLVYYKDILNYQRHIIHRMGTSTLCTVSIHNVVYT